jgi:hypothetical protein
VCSGRLCDPRAARTAAARDALSWHEPLTCVLTRATICWTPARCDSAARHWHLLILGRSARTTACLADCERVVTGVAHRSARRGPRSHLAGVNSSMRLPAGSANRIWRPPGPATTSLRKDSPALRRRSISASRSSTVRWMRLRPGVAASEGVARAPELGSLDGSSPVLGSPAPKRRRTLQDAPSARC